MALFTEKEWSHASKEAATEHLVKFCKCEETHLIKHIRFEEYMKLLNYLNQYVIAYSSTSVKKKQDALNNISAEFEMNLVETSESKHLILLTLFFGEFMKSVIVDSEFGDADHSQFWKSLASQPTLGAILKNKRYTSLILYALYIIIDSEFEEEYEHTFDEFMETLGQEFYMLHREELDMAKERIEPIKEEIIATACHPSRLQRWIDMGYSIEEIEEFY